MVQRLYQEGLIYRKTWSRRSDLRRHCRTARLDFPIWRSDRSAVAVLGLSGRAVDPSDARGAIICPTEGGKAALKSMHDARTALVASALDGAGDRESVAHAVRVLNEIAEGIELRRKAD